MLHERKNSTATCTLRPSLPFGSSRMQFPSCVSVGDFRVQVSCARSKEPHREEHALLTALHPQSMLTLHARVNLVDQLFFSTRILELERRFASLHRDTVSMVLYQSTLSHGRRRCRSELVGSVATQPTLATSPRGYALLKSVDPSFGAQKFTNHLRSR